MGKTATAVNLAGNAYEQFVGDTTPLDLRGVSEELAVKYQTAKSWRRDALESVRDQMDLLVIGQWLAERELTRHPEALFPVVNRYLRRAGDDERAQLRRLGMVVYDVTGKKPRSPRLLIEEFGKPGVTAAVCRNVLGSVAGPIMVKLARWGVDNLDRRVSLLKVEHGLAGDLGPGAMTQADVDALKLTPHPHHLLMPDRFEWKKAIFVRGRLRRWALQSGKINPVTLQAQHSKPPGRPADADEDVAKWEVQLALAA